MDGLDRIAQARGELGDLVTGIGRVAAAVVEEIADVVGLEDLDQTFVLAPIGLQALQFVATGTKGAGGGVAQRRDGLVRLQAGVDQILGERADDAVASGIDLGDPVRVTARGLDHTTGRGIDDGGHPTGLGIEGILG
jgi:hypothetical protein